MSFPSGSYHSDADVIPTYTVCIIGDPQSGKSCFCNRFVYSHPDWYQEGHPSVLSEADFSGPVVNFDHWLYWGTVTRRLDDEASVRFCVIEQTEFLSDATSLPFRSPKKLSLSSNASSIHLNNVATASGVASPTNVTPFPLKELHSSNRLHDYILRSTAINLYSPGKLRYYSFEKLGQEQHCQQESFHNPGPLEVHGFLVIYDVSRRASCHDLPDHHQQQFSFLVDVLTLISKRKKPIVVVASKRDAVDEQCLSGVIQFLQKSADFRKIPIVEVSAHRNINVELAFLTLARLLDGTGNGNKSRCSKIKLLSYQDAIREQEEHQRRLREAFVNRVSLSPVGFLTDWQTFLSRYSHQSDVARFIDLWGSEVARETFEQFTAQWKNETKRRHLAKLPDALSTMLLYVGPVTNQPPGDILQRLRTHSQFEHFFISEKSSDDPINDSNFLQRHGVQKDESKIPFSLALKEPPDNGDSPFIESIKSLVCAEAWAANMSAFEDILLQRQFIGTKDFSLTILPGQSFNDYKLSLIDSGSDLSHEEKLEVYQKFQECIRLTAREEFLDLLLEHLPQFICVVSDYLTCLGDNYITTAASVLQTPPNRFPDMNRSRPASPVSEQTNVPIRSVQLPSADIRLCAGLAPPRGAKEQQLGLIRDRISCDRRYRAMDYMPSERQTLLASHFDILLPRSSKTEISPSQPQTSFHRHYSCSFVDQNNSFKLAFPLPHCPAYQTGRCMDLLFTNLCSDFGWGVRWEQGSFSSHLSCLLGQGGDKRLCVAVCAVCTDVTAASAAINLFRAAGFTPEGVTSPNQLTTCYYSGSTQTLVSSWPLASTLLTPADNVASLIGNPMISTVMGTVQATFLSHHELLSMVANPRQSSNIFDGVILLLSKGHNVSSPSSIPSCTCQDMSPGAFCCKCSRGALNCSHNTPRPRSFFSLATAVKALAEHLAPMPHLLVLVSTADGIGEGGRQMEPSIYRNRFFATQLHSPSEPVRSLPQTPVARNCSGERVTGSSQSFSFDDADLEEPSLPFETPHSPVNFGLACILDKLSAFLSTCWTRKLISSDDGCQDESGVHQSTSPKTKGGAEGVCGSVHESRFRHTVPLCQLRHHHRRCSYRRHHNHRRHIRRHHHHHHHRCSKAAAPTAAVKIFRTSSASSFASSNPTTTLNCHRPPKLTLTPALPAQPRKFVRSYSLPAWTDEMSSCVPLTQPTCFAAMSYEPTRFLSRSLSTFKYRRKTVSHFETEPPLTTGSSDSKLGDGDATVENTPKSNQTRMSQLVTSTLEPPSGDCSSAASCSPHPMASQSSRLVFASERTTYDPVFLKFSEGVSPTLPDGAGSVEVHVLSEQQRRRRLRKKGCKQRIQEVEPEAFHNINDALEMGTIQLIPCPHIQRPPTTPPPQFQSASGLVCRHSLRQQPVEQNSLDFGLNHRGSSTCEHNYQPHNNIFGVAPPTTTSTGGSVSSFFTSGIRAVASGFGRPRERRRSVSTPCGGELPNNTTGSLKTSCVVVPSCVSSHTASSTPGSGRAGEFYPNVHDLETSQGAGGDYPTTTLSKASTPPFSFDDLESIGIFAGGGGSGGTPLLRLQVTSLDHLTHMAASSRPAGKGGCFAVTPRHWHLPSCPHRLCIPRQNLVPPSQSTTRRHPPSLTTARHCWLQMPVVSGASPSSKTLHNDKQSFKSSHCTDPSPMSTALPPESRPPALRHLPASPSKHLQYPPTLQPPFAGDQQSTMDLLSSPSNASSDDFVPSISRPGTFRTAATAMAQCGEKTVPRPSPPLALSSSTNHPPSSLSTGFLLSSPVKESFLSPSASGRRSKRNVLSLFSGRTNISLSEPQPQKCKRQQTFSTGPGGGASFPSTPIRDPSGVQTVLSFGHHKAKSTTPPAPNSAAINNT